MNGCAKVYLWFAAMTGVMAYFISPWVLWLLITPWHCDGEPKGAKPKFTKD